MKLIFLAHAICRCDCESESFTVLESEDKRITKKNAMKFHNRVTSTSGIKLYKPGFTIKKIFKKKVQQVALGK